MRVGEVLQGLGRPIAYFPALARMTGSANATLLLCHLIYWSDKGHHPDGWIYKSKDEIERETGLTRREQDTARQALESVGLVASTRRGWPATVHYRIDFERLDEAWDQLHESAQLSVAQKRLTERTKTPNSTFDTKTTQETTNTLDLAVEERCRLLADLIEGNGFKRPPASAVRSWRTDYERMIRLDHRDPEEAEAVMRWALDHEFWRRNIGSMAKLRKQYDRLRDEMRSENNGHRSRRRDYDDDLADIAEAMRSEGAMGGQD